MLKRLSVLIIISVFTSAAAAQGHSKHSNRAIIQDTLIDQLLDYHKRANSREQKVNGYRVHIYSDSGVRSKLRTDNEKADFDEKYPHIMSYITYDEPNYRIRVGDFRTRLDATRFLREVQRYYPSAYIVPERINFPELDIHKKDKEKPYDEEHQLDSEYEEE